MNILSIFALFIVAVRKVAKTFFFYDGVPNLTTFSECRERARASEGHIQVNNSADNVPIITWDKLCAVITRLVRGNAVKVINELSKFGKRQTRCLNQDLRDYNMKIGEKELIVLERVKYLSKIITSQQSNKDERIRLGWIS